MIGAAQPGVGIEEEARTREAVDPGWNVVVWNDEVNLMSYVVFVFQRVLGLSRERATRHMLEVHHQGRSCVATGPREKAELYWQQIQQYGLRATLERAGSES
ncbi:MAG: ATP-dependent Clp protease adapter ClpS [Verrucomicrobiae bacterium]|nr:ATP-dependent Clp protease adapter ClpS [Verrucomicrobiae bacterium]